MNCVLVSVGASVRTFAQLVEPAAVRALDMPFRSQVKEDLGMAQCAAATIAGDAVGIDGDDFERLGHDLAPTIDRLAAAANDDRGGAAHVAEIAPGRHVV